ncbi:MAG: ribulose-phosphate 3-epimerase [Elusimicrobiota bacterium]
MKYIISPSILTADLSDLRAVVKLIENNGTGWIHLDVMDGNFVRNLTFGHLIVKAIRKLCGKALVLDTHLMIDYPEKYVQDYITAGADIITVHHESKGHPWDAVKIIKSSGKKAGVSLKPKTKVEAIKKQLSQLDLVLMMTVEPGFGGQKFMREVLPKIFEVRDIVDKKKYKVDIEVDGGIAFDTLPDTITAGANVFVLGNAVFGAKKPGNVLRQYSQLIKTVQG